MYAVRWAHHHRTVVAMACAAVALAGCSSSEEGDFPGNDRPGCLVGEQRFAYDGTSDDLLTVGLGKTGLGASTAPGFVNPAAPTATELRRSAIWNNYRAIVDVSPKGGYGILYGSNPDANGQDTLGEGKVAGVEYVGLADDVAGTKHVTLAVQIPNSRNRNRPCIGSGTSSGSRGVHGPIGSSGEWGLKRGCAVAYADKGTGNGVHDLATDTVNLVDGTRATSMAASKGSNFTSITGSALTSFNVARPNRIAVKHAHSQQNPEKDWGTNALYAIPFAIWALNQEYNQITPDGYVQAVFDNTNTIVIASSVSYGAGTALAAATALAQIFGTGNGVPPTSGIQIINNPSVGGPIRDKLSTSPSTGLMDYNVDGALCQRNLWTGTDAAATNLRSGVNATLRNANLRGKPAIIVHGHSDTLVPPAFTSRPYFGQKRITEGSASRLSYVEVTNAQHFDAFIDNPALPGYDSMFVPLHYYFNQALDLMYAHLASGGPLPPAQVVHTIPRGGTPGAAPQITAANVPPILNNPAASDLITFSDGTVTIPD